MLVNNDLTDSIQIFKGTRQGCPLSPLLFILTLEVLLDQIRNHPHIQGLETKGFHCKLRAFANDLVIILEEPLN